MRGGGGTLKLFGPGHIRTLLAYTTIPCCVNLTTGFARGLIQVQ